MSISFRTIGKFVARQKNRDEISLVEGPGAESEWVSFGIFEWNLLSVIREYDKCVVATIRIGIAKLHNFFIMLQFQFLRMKKTFRHFYFNRNHFGSPLSQKSFSQFDFEFVDKNRSTNNNIIYQKHSGCTTVIIKLNASTFCSNFYEFVIRQMPLGCKSVPKKSGSPILHI